MRDILWLNEVRRHMHCQFVLKSNRESNVIMTITMKKALHPLLLTFSVLGFGIYFPEKAYLNIFYDLSIWIIYFCLYDYLVIELKVERKFSGTWTRMNTLISIFVIIISVIMNIYNNKVYICIFNAKIN